MPHSALGKLQKPKLDLLEAVDLDPRSVEALTSLASVQSQLLQHEDAIESHRRVIEELNSPDALPLKKERIRQMEIRGRTALSYLNIAVSYRKLGQYDRAGEALQKGRKFGIPDEFYRREMQRLTSAQRR